MERNQETVSPYLLSREKRTLDLTIATALGPLALLVWSGSAAAMAANNSTLDLLFREERVGRRHKPVNITKLRTLDDHGEPLRLGRLVRRLGIDESLQLMHIYTREMSIVGPRILSSNILNTTYRRLKKHEDSSTSDIENWMSLREQALPGITGPTQISNLRLDQARLSQTFAWVNLELYYLLGGTLREDLRIIGRTPLALLSRTNHTSLPGQDTKSPASLQDHPYSRGSDSVFIDPFEDTT